MGDSQNPFGTTVLLPPDYMIGAIILWSGAIVDIPTHWQLCDGTNGTPDLREKFIMGAGVISPPGITGGNVNHNHPFTGSGHIHGLATGTDVAAGTDYSRNTGPAATTGTTDNTDGRPPYYALAYIQRIS